MTKRPTSPGNPPPEDAPGAGGTLPAPWVVVSHGPQGPPPQEHQVQRLLATVALGLALVLGLVIVGGIFGARILAEREAVNDAANTADLLADAVVQPALSDAIVDGDPLAVSRLDDAVGQYVASSTLVRVKLWSRDGRILYSDEPLLIGQQFELDSEEQEVFDHPLTRAGVSDLQKPENVYERGQGKLLEAYRPVWTPSGTPLLFEIYSPYDEVNARAGQLWRGFAGITVSSLLLFTALLVPLLWRLLSRLREVQHQRETLLEHAVEASADERRRIASTLHDGVVQELVATSFTVGAAATRAAEADDGELARDLEAAGTTIRDSLSGLRTLLVDIYPDTLESAGLVAVLRDLATTVRSRDVAAHLDLPAQDPPLGRDGDRLVFRVVHECLQNVRRHSSARNVWVSLRETDEAYVVEVSDDGVGFDADRVLAHPPAGHFGLRILTDLVRDSDARLSLSAAPGAGCRWRLEVPR